MCLVALSLNTSTRFPIVIATNRDEYFDRAAQPLNWWKPKPEAAAVLSGCDLSAGGAWFGLTHAGRLALVTNVRAPSRHRADAPSRGNIVLDWLLGDTTFPAYAAQLRQRRYNGFNLIAADLQRDAWFWTSNHSEEVKALSSGTFGLSNALLDTPWPKVNVLKHALADAVALANDREQLAARLFAVLAERDPFPDEMLPATGVPLDRERLLSPVFISIPAAAGMAPYGTRVSTLLIAERGERGLRVCMLERTHFTDGRAANTVSHEVDGWPD